MWIDLYASHFISLSVWSRVALYFLLANFRSRRSTDVAAGGRKPRKDSSLRQNFPRRGPPQRVVSGLHPKLVEHKVFECEFVACQWLSGQVMNVKGCLQNMVPETACTDPICRQILTAKSFVFFVEDLWPGSKNVLIPKVVSD